MVSGEEELKRPHDSDVNIKPRDLTGRLPSIIPL